MVDYEPHSYYNVPSLNISMSQFIFHILHVASYAVDLLRQL